MNVAEALGWQGATLLSASFVCLIIVGITSDSYSETPRGLTILAWVLPSLTVASFIASAWASVLL